MRKNSQGGGMHPSPSKIQTMSLEIKARQNRYNLECDPSTHGLIEMRDLELQSIEQYPLNQPLSNTIQQTIPQQSNFDYSQVPATQRLQALLARSTLIKEYEKTIAKTKQHQTSRSLRDNPDALQGPVQAYLRSRGDNKPSKKAHTPNSHAYPSVTSAASPNAVFREQRRAMRKAAGFQSMHASTHNTPAEKDFKRVLGGDAQRHKSTSKLHTAQAQEQFKQLNKNMSMSSLQRLNYFSGVTTAHNKDIAKRASAHGLFDRLHRERFGPKNQKFMSMVESTEDKCMQECTFQPNGERVPEHVKNKRSADAFYREMVGHKERISKWREEEKQRAEQAEADILELSERQKIARLSPGKTSTRAALEAKIHERLHGQSLKNSRRASRSPAPASQRSPLRSSRSRSTQRNGISVHEALYEESFRKKQAEAIRVRQREQRVEVERRGEEVFSESSAFYLKEKIVRETAEACRRLGIEDEELSLRQAGKIMEELGYMRRRYAEDRARLEEAWRGLCGAPEETVRRKNFLKFLLALNNLCFSDALEESARSPPRKPGDNVSQSEEEKGTANTTERNDVSGRDNAQVTEETDISRRFSPANSRRSSTVRLPFGVLVDDEFFFRSEKELRQVHRLFRVFFDNKQTFAKASIEEQARLRASTSQGELKPGLSKGAAQAAKKKLVTILRTQNIGKAARRLILRPPRLR